MYTYIYTYPLLLILPPPPLPSFSWFSCRGLVNVFLSRWQLAKDCFESALQLEPNNLTLKNNITVCTFYQGHLKEVCHYTCIRILAGIFSTHEHTHTHTHTHSVSVSWRVWLGLVLHPPYNQLYSVISLLLMILNQAPPTPRNYHSFLY